MSELKIRAAEERDQSSWCELWKGYLHFYRAAISEEGIDNTWHRLLSPDSGIHALVAELDGEVVGLCHYLFHESTWKPQPACYLQDLFVGNAARGSGVAKALILACEQKAIEGGASRLYWLTQEYNAAARSLYDTITPRSSFIVYRKEV